MHILHFYFMGQISTHIVLDALLRYGYKSLVVHKYNSIEVPPPLENIYIQDIFICLFVCLFLNIYQESTAEVKSLQTQLTNTEINNQNMMTEKMKMEEQLNRYDLLS